MKSYIETTDKKNTNILRINYEKNSIQIDPEYQRNGDIWSLEKRQFLIDSIINDFDIPKFYFHALNKEQREKIGKEYAVVDGRQRLEAIWKFINGDFSLSKDFVYFKDRNIKAEGMTYADLAKHYPELKMLFDSFNLPIVLIETEDLDLIDEMFLRLNEAVPLNAAEKRNAIRGKMALAINKVSEHVFFKEKVAFGNKRYQYKEVAARLLFLVHSMSVEKRIVDTKKVYLDNFVTEYKNNKQLKSAPILTHVMTVLDYLSQIFTEKDPLLRSQSSVPIYFLLADAALANNKNIDRRGLVKFRDVLTKNKAVAENDISKAKFEYLEYDRLSQQGTNDASSIRERLKIITEYFSI